MADDPSVYGSYMNFFLPQSARVGSSQATTPGLFDLLGNMGMSNWGGAGQPGAPEEQAQQKKQQEQQKQNLAMAQQGLKMLAPQQTAPAPQPMPVAPQQTQRLPQPQPQQQAEPPPPPPERPPTSGYDPRDPRSRNPIAGMPTPFGGFYR